MLIRARWARIAVALLVVCGAGSLSLPAAAAPPANDSFAAAELLTGRTAIAVNSNDEATKETGEPEHAGDPGGASLWFEWTAPASGRAMLSTCSSDFDTLLAAYTGGSVASLAEVAANDDDCGTRSAIAFDAVEGTAYRVAVDGKAGATGVVVLELRLAPPNDDFADAVSLTGDAGSVSGTTIGASEEQGEPVHYGDGYSSVWYFWTAPSSGWATFETCGTAFDTVLTAYTGSGFDDLELVAGNDEGCAPASRVVFEATAGIEYRIAVAGYEGATGDFTLAWNRNPPPLDPPSPEESPRISGLAREGDTLTASEGVWSGGQPMSFSYAWGRCDRDDERCALIGGATARTYVPASGDVGWRLFVRVTAANAVGSSPAFSGLTALVAARPPVNRLVPQVSGAARPGSILVATAGEWTGAGPISLAYRWQSCDASEVTCVDLPGQAAPVMRVNASHRGKRLRAVVTATNPGGSASAQSNATALVRVVRARRCVVPNVKGKPIAGARRALRRANCRPGRVRKSHSASVRGGRVISQSPRAGARRAAGARVDLVLSKGRKR
jgi:PASTA domain